MGDSLPLIACLAGLGLLYGAWSGRVPVPGVSGVGGWLLLAISFVLWVRVAGPEFGSVYAVLAVAPAAWLFVALHPKRGRPARERAAARRAPRLPARGRLTRNVALFFVAVPLAAVTSTLFALVASTWLPWSAIDRTVAGLLAMPVIWGLLAYWACADEKLLRPAAMVVATGLLSGIALYS